jgi:hypothetical protein
VAQESCVPVHQIAGELMEVFQPGGSRMSGSAQSGVNYVLHEDLVTMINEFHISDAY